MNRLLFASAICVLGAVACAVQGKWDNAALLVACAALAAGLAFQCGMPA
jgi:hypothetical protein